MMHAPIRVLELRSVSGTGGGPEKTILLGTARTDPRRFAITVCYLRNQRDEVFRIGEWARSIGVNYAEIHERHSFDLATFTALRQLVREHRIQIIHAHEYKSNVLAWMLAKAEGVIPMSTGHGWTGHSHRERLIYYPLDKWILTKFPRVIAVSGEIRGELLRWGASPQAVSVVLNGIDHLKFVRDDLRRVPARRSLDVQPEEIVIGAVGRLEPQKRFDLLIQAFARLRAARPTLRLIIVGDGSMQEELARLISELGLDGVCRLQGHSPDVATLHHAFDLLVQSSDYEGTPNAVLEAMAMRTPIVATDVGGTAELVQNGVHGLIVQPGDVAHLCAGIEKALGHPGDARERAQAARLRVERELSFDRRMRRVEAVYEELLDGEAESDRARRTA
jgi:glycosyltransferase involved in cell wall biosynthesis